MTIRAIIRGLRLALASPGLLVALWLMSLLVALPAGVAMRQAIVENVGDGAVHEEIRGELEMGWLGELHHEGGELERSLTPLRLSPLAPLENLEGWAAGDLFEAPPALVAIGGLQALIWIFVLGGLIERFAAGGGPFRVGGLLAAGAHNFSRLLVLALLSLPVYWSVYRLARVIFGGIEKMTRDVTVEKTVLIWYCGAWTLIVVLLLLVHTIFGFAKVAAVVESRRNAPHALLRGASFVAQHPLRAFGVELGLSGLGLLIVVAYTMLAPGPEGATVPSILGAFLVGQIFVVARLTQRLALCAGWTAVYLDTRHPAAG